MSPFPSRVGFFTFSVVALQWVLLINQVIAASPFSGERLGKYVGHPAFQWETTTTDHSTIYYEANTATVPRLHEIKESIEESRASVLRLIQVKEFRDRIYVFLVDSRARMKDLMGAEQFGGAIAKIRVVFAVVNASNNGCSTHEFCHVIASSVWGKPERWLDEGFASFSDVRWSNRDVVAAALADQHRLLPLRILAEDFLKYPEGITYIQASSFLAFVIDRYGMEKFRAVWRGGFKRMPKELGRTVEELEAEWRASLRLVTSQPSRQKRSERFPGF
jgi:hypothetical protein